jgi:hypothetical protein
MSQTYDKLGNLICPLCQAIQCTSMDLEAHYLAVHGIAGPTSVGELEEVSSGSLKTSTCPITETSESVNSEAPTEELSVNILFDGKPEVVTIDIASSDSTPSSKELYEPTESEIPSFSNGSAPSEKATTTDAIKWTCEFCEEGNYTYLSLEKHQVGVHGELGFGIPDTDRPKKSTTKKLTEMISLSKKLEKARTKRHPPQKPPRKLIVPQNSPSSKIPSTVSSPPRSSPTTRALARLRVKKALFLDLDENTSLTTLPTYSSSPPNPEPVKESLNYQRKYLQVSLKRLTEEELWLLGGPDVLKPSGPLPLPDDSELQTAQELENERLFTYYATLLEKKAILDVEKSKRHIIFRNMRQNLLNRVDERVFEFI